MRPETWGSQAPPGSSRRSQFWGDVAGSALAGDRDATPSTFASVFSSAAGRRHDPSCIRESRDVRGALKSGTVTITARPGDARLAIGALAVDMALNRSTARAKVTLDR